MFEYTKNNHFRFGYSNGSLYKNRKSEKDVFIASYGSVEEEIISWRETNEMACRDIASKAQGDVWVLLSGGVDSEICVRSFLEAQIPIKIATLRFKNGINEEDVALVKNLESEWKVTVKYYDLDIEAFFSSRELYEIVDPIQCVSPILACHLWLADQVGGTPVIAQGEPHLKKDIPSDYIPGESEYLASSWRIVESERLCSLYKHFILQDRPAIPGFFQYLPEQILSYVKHNPMLIDLVNNRIVGKLGTRTSKNQMAYQFYPELRPRQKLTGFEKIQNLHDIKRKELAERFHYSDANTYIEYNELLKMLTSNLANQQFFDRQSDSLLV